MSSQRRPPLVFVVEDDVVTSQMMQGVLTRAGYEVASASDAASGLAGIRQHHPDLILLDVNLPDGSGFDVCLRLQNEPGARQTPVLFISADSEVSSKIRGFEAGGVDYIPKPFAGEEVIARVSTHLRLRQAYESLAELQAERIQRLVVAQEALMPSATDFPEAKFEVWLQQILHAGGDFYDVIPVGNQVIDYVVADASGHDLAISFWTAALKTLLGEYATPANSPQNILRSINGALCRILPEGMFFTVIYARLNRQTGKVLLLSAGHPPALVLQSTTETAAVIRQVGDVVGSFADASFGMVQLKVRPGDRLFLLSDGLIESHGGCEAGIRRLTAACETHRHAPLADMVQRVASEVTDDRKVLDDILLMGVEM